MMPKRDGTGPQGKGPQTGVKMGACQGSANIPFEQGTKTRGCGQERGLGNRWRNCGNNSLSTSCKDETSKS